MTSRVLKERRLRCGVEVRPSQDETTRQAVRAIGVSEHSYYRWRRQYSGAQIGQAKRMREVDEESTRSRQASRISLMVSN